MQLRINEQNYPLTPIVFAVTEEIAIERVKSRDGQYRWAVRRNGECLSRKLEWDYEPFPSSRTDEWLRLNRFDSVEEAHALAVRAIEKERMGLNPDAGAAECP